MAEFDRASGEAKLKQAAGKWYDPTMVDDLERNTSNNGGGDVDEWVGRLASKAQLRGDNESGSTYQENGQGGTMSAAAQQQQSGVGGAGGSGNSSLDGLVQQMIAGQKAQQERDAASAAEHQQQRETTRKNIMDRYEKVSQPVDMSNPILARAAQVHSAAAQRSLNQGREAMAARNAVTRTGTGATDAQVGGMYENLGRDQSGYESGLMMNENDKNRSEMDDLLHLGAGVLSSDEDRMLREKMGTIDAAQGNLSLGLQRQQIGNNFTLGNRGMDIQDRQFYDNMGNQNGLQAAMMNQYIMSQLMGK